jgi:8-oxo-dGTP pyrophosphatase MutT (NUDIX family)
VFDVDTQLRQRLREVGDWQPTELRRAAVLCPIVARDGVDHLLFGLRPQSRDAHAGQIAFPGGKVEGDERPVETALRECLEEVGMPPENVTPLGELPPRTSTSRFYVHCVVARVRPFELRLDPREVDRALFVPLPDLQRADRWRELPPPMPTRVAQPRTSPHFVFGEDRIWGLTGRFVRELVGLLGELRP